MDLQTLLARLDAHGLPRREFLAIQIHLLNDDRQRRRTQRLRINRDDAFDRRKPELPIRRFPPCRLMPSITLAALHAISHAIRSRSDRADATCDKVAQLLTADPKDA